MTSCFFLLAFVALVWIVWVLATKGDEREPEFWEEEVYGPEPVLGLEQAKRENRCRICGETTISLNRWAHRPVVFAYGEEHAHRDCL